MSESSAPQRDDTNSHALAAGAFAQRVQHMSAVEDLFLFGSTARGEASGLESDVDFLAVVSNDAPETVEQLRDHAYDVMLEFGPVIEVHVFTCSEFDERRDHPFVRRVREEGQSYA